MGAPAECSAVQGDGVLDSNYYQTDVGCCNPTPIGPTSADAPQIPYILLQPGQAAVVYGGANIHGFGTFPKTAYVPLVTAAVHCWDDGTNGYAWSGMVKHGENQLVADEARENRRILYNAGGTARAFGCMLYGFTAAVVGTGPHNINWNAGANISAGVATWGKAWGSANDISGATGHTLIHPSLTSTGTCAGGIVCNGAGSSEGVLKSGGFALPAWKTSGNFTVRNDLQATGCPHSGYCTTQANNLSNSVGVYFNAKATVEQYNTSGQICHKTSNFSGGQDLFLSNPKHHKNFWSSVTVPIKWNVNGNQGVLCNKLDFVSRVVVTYQSGDPLSIQPGAPGTHGLVTGASEGGAYFY